MTKQLILLRHAKSDWYSDASSDHDRPLNNRGRVTTPKVGQWLGGNIKQPDLVLCSTAVRARETLSLLAITAKWSNLNTNYRRQLYLATEGEILHHICVEFHNYNNVMLIAHNPGLDLCLLHFCPQVLPTEDQKLMTTASFAIITFSDAKLSHPQLHTFKRPAEC